MSCLSNDALLVGTLVSTFVATRATTDNELESSLVKRGLGKGELKGSATSLGGYGQGNSSGRRHSGRRNRQLTVRVDRKLCYSLTKLDRLRLGEPRAGD